VKVFLFNPLYIFPLDGKRERYYIRSGSRWPHSGIKRRGTLPHYLPFPFFLAYAAAWLKKEGFEVVTCDCVALDMPPEDLLARIEAEKPDLLFFETATPTIKFDLDLAGRIKRRPGGARLALGGPHSSVYPVETLEKNPAIDFVIIGEYEESLVELARALRDNLPAAEVKGLAYRAEGGVKLSAPRGLIEPLDKLPAPAHGLFPASWRPDPGVYWDGFCQHRPALQMHASRGCPYRCDFCLWNQVMYSNGKYRTFPASRIVDEMESLKRLYGAKEIYFDDDDFTILAPQVEAIAGEISARGLDIKWSCMGDAVNLSRELVEKMAASGCVGIKFGVESGSPRVLKSLGKPLDLEKARQVTDWCGAVGIRTHATFSLGLPEDDMESLLETLKFLEDFNADSIQVSICTPFPGTRFFRKAEAEKLLKTVDWEKYDGKAGDVLKHPRVDLGAVEKLRVRAVRRWLLRRLVSPSWLAKQVRYSFRLLRGLGPAFIWSQLRSVVEEQFLLSK
jgi:radical SAM superfamily enzyme YgiQ (UPF0313 family)